MTNLVVDGDSALSAARAAEISMCVAEGPDGLRGSGMNFVPGALRDSAVPLVNERPECLHYGFFEFVTIPPGEEFVAGSGDRDQECGGRNQLER